MLYPLSYEPTSAAADTTVSGLEAQARLRHRKLSPPQS